MTIFNPEIHLNLLALGYTFEFHAAEWEDTGNGETGPMVSGHPGYNQYTSADDFIFIGVNGEFLDRELRDLELEAFCDRERIRCGYDPESDHE